MTDQPAGGAATVLIAHPSADLYGSDRVMLSSVEALVGAGHRVVVTLPGTGPLVAEIVRRGATVEFCPSPVLRKSAAKPLGFAKLVLDSARSLPKSIRVLRRSGSEVVYVNTLTIPLWILVGRLLRKPVLCHVHEAEASAPMVLRRLLALPLLFADKLVLNSQFSLDVIAGAFSRLADRAVIIYNAVPGPVELVPARALLTDPTRLLFVGRLSPRKGPDVAIEAVVELAKRGVPVELDLVGAEFPGYEWFTTQLQDRVTDQGLTDQVHFRGFHTDIWPFLAKTDIAVVPSTIDEPFGNTAVEALLAARPLIVSATSGLVEAVNGHESVNRVTPGRPLEIADAVQRIVGDWPTYRAAAEADSRRAAASYDSGSYGRQVVDVVDTLRRGSHASSRSAGGVMPQPTEQVSAPTGARTADDSLKVVVAMATYHRPDELVRTLHAVLTQIDEVGRPIEVLVVDNDATGSARTAVEQLGDDRVNYVVEAKPGIAAARNRALNESAAHDLLIFIDDDEKPRAGWLSALLATFGRHRPAAVVGPVVSEFDGELDPWIAAGGFFERRRLPTGTTVEAAATNNLLLDLRIIRSLGLQFDERFGLSGGSDTLFTRTLTEAGETIMWCDEAVVVDHVPVSRATREWVTRRAMRYGNSWSRTSIAMSRSSATRVRARTAMVARGAVRIAGGTGRLAIGTVTRSNRHRARGLRTTMKGVGYMRGAVGSTYVEYARPAA